MTSYGRRRCGASGDIDNAACCFPSHMRNSRRTAYLRVSPLLAGKTGATSQQAIRRARRSARGFRGRTRRAVLSPVAQPPGEDYGRGRKGAHTSALDVERAEIPGNAASCFPSHMRNSRRVALCGVSHSRKVESEATRQRGELSSPTCGTAAARNRRDGAYRLMEVGFRATSQRGELSFPICGTAAARNCRDGAYRLMEARFRGTRQRAIRRRRLHRRSHYDQLLPPTIWSERRYPLMIERSKGRKVSGITQEKANMTRNRSPQMLSTCSSALCTSSGPRLSAASARASVSA